MEEKQIVNGVPNGVLEVPELPLESADNFRIQRGEKGKFMKGMSANPSGKPKGALTKRTEKLKMMMDGTLSDMWPKYVDTLRRLEGKEFAQEYRALMEFRMPRLARLDSTNISLQQDKPAQTIKIGDTEFEIN